MRFTYKHENNKILMTDLKHGLKLLFIKFNKNGFRVTGYESHPALKMQNTSHLTLRNDNSQKLRLIGYCKNNYITKLQFKNSDLPNEININVANCFIYDIMHFNHHNKNN